MATAANSDDESTEKNYRITLSDIRGVGSATIQKLADIGIESVRGTFLLRRSTSPSYNKLKDRGVGADTLDHLQAVGKAVHYEGTDRVEAKHLTHPDAQEVRPSKFVSLVADTPTEAGTDPGQQSLDDADSFDPDMDQLAEAVAAIQEEYRGGFGKQMAFEGDLAGHIFESERFEGDEHELPQGVIQSVVRYEHDADRVAAQRDYEPVHGAILISFADTLSG